MQQMRLCVDFGSAYTKVALRPDWDAPTQLLKEEKLNLDELHVCVPTVVARVKRGDETQWAWGLTAAGMKEGNGIKVYRNWKQRFFSRHECKAVPVPAVATGSKVGVFLQTLDGLARERSRLIKEIATLQGEHPND